MIDVAGFDIQHVITSGTIGIATIAVIKNDLKWIKSWMQTHDKHDDERFRDLTAHVDKLRDKE
jgi:hypothetical protein